MRRQIAAATTAAVLFPACGTFHTGTPQWPFPTLAEGASDVCGSVCTDKDARLAVSTALKFCRGVGNYYERGGRESDNVKLGLGLFGVLAGSVFGLTAGGVGGKAWSSMSGATNGLQTQLNESASGSGALLGKAQRVSVVADAYRAKLELLVQESPQRPAVIVQVAQSAALACASVNEAVGPPPSTTTPPPEAPASAASGAAPAASAASGVDSAASGTAAAHPPPPPPAVAQGPAPANIGPISVSDSIRLIEAKQRAAATADRARQAAIESSRRAVEAAQAASDAATLQAQEAKTQ